MTPYRTTRRHFTEAELGSIMALVPSCNRSVTALWDDDTNGSTCTIRAHKSEFPAVLKAIRIAAPADR